MDDSKRAPVSVVIPVKNEEPNLLACLNSVKWAAEVYVVDSGSTDSTIAIAEEWGAKVVQFQFAPGGPKKKNWALANIAFSHEWVLILDADERITPGLAEEISGLVVSPSTHAGYYLSRRLFFLGKPIRWAGYFPGWNLRLFRPGRAFYERPPSVDTASGDNEVHEHVLLDGTAGYLRNPMDHYAYRTIDEFIDKHQRYASWEARLADQVCATSDGRFGSQTMSVRIRLKRSAKRLARTWIAPHWARFVYHYWFRLGFLDGLPGYIFCHLVAEYEFWIFAKAREIEFSKASDGNQSARQARLNEGQR